MHYKNDTTHLRINTCYILRISNLLEILVSSAILLNYYISKEKKCVTNLNYNNYRIFTLTYIMNFQILNKVLNVADSHLFVNSIVPLKMIRIC